MSKAITKLPTPKPNSFYRSSSSIPSYSPPPPPPPRLQNPHRIADTALIAAISAAIADSHKTALHASLKPLLPSLGPRHLFALLAAKSLTPHSLLAFFQCLSSSSPAAASPHCFGAMAHFLAARGMGPKARSLLRSLVARQGEGSAPSLFAALEETRGGYGANLGFRYNADHVFDDLIVAYADCGFVPDAVRSVRLASKARFCRFPVRGCGFLLDRMMKAGLPRLDVWRFLIFAGHIIISSLTSLACIWVFF